MTSETEPNPATRNLSPSRRKFIHRIASLPIKEAARDYYVRWAEDWTKARGQESPERTQAYFDALGRSPHIADWRFRQAVDAARILACDILAIPWAVSFPWQSLADQAWSLKSTHRTLARDTIPVAGTCSPSLPCRSVAKEGPSRGHVVPNLPAKENLMPRPLVAGASRSRPSQEHPAPDLPVAGTCSPSLPCRSTAKEGPSRGHPVPNLPFSSLSHPQSPISNLSIPLPIPSASRSDDPESELTSTIDALRRSLRLKNKAVTTEETYVYWNSRFIRFCFQRLGQSPRTIGPPVQRQL